MRPERGIATRESNVRALLRPLILAGCVIASACRAPGAREDVRPAPVSTAATSPSHFPRNVLLSNEARARLGASGTPRTTSGGVFGPKDLLAYYGGPVISNVHVVAVDWTDVSDPSNTVNPTLVSTLPGFYATVTAGPYFSWLAEYNTAGLSYSGVTSNQTIGFGTFDSTSGGTGPGGTYVITPTANLTHTVADSDIQSELEYQLTSGHLPAPVMDTASNTVDSLYVFDFPPEFTINAFGGTSCVDFCGYHSTLVYGSSALYVPYDVLIDVTGAGCASCKFGKTSLDDATFVHAHELAEAVTDPGAGIGSSITDYGWEDFSTYLGEIGDLCASVSGVDVSSYYVTTLWSDANGACIATAPLCDSTTPPPPSCTPCTTSGAPPCASPRPICDTDVASPAHGHCVGCLTAADCGGNTPVCDATTLACRGCQASDCSGETPVCATSGFDTGLCVQCVEASQCSGATPACNTTTYACVGCLSNGDCAGTTPICNAAEVCVPCSADADCSPGVCDTSSGACVQCKSNADCGSLVCDVSSHSCVCDSASQCSNPSPVCSSSKTCAPCKTNGDCSGNPAGGACSTGSCVECNTSADCAAPAPVCDERAHKCVMGARAPDAGGPPDGGGRPKDGGAGDAPPASASGGCTTASAGAGSSGLATGAWALVAVLSFFRRQRRR